MAQFQTLIDASIDLSGSAQQLLPKQGHRCTLIIANPSQTNFVWVTFNGADPVAGAKGTIGLTPFGSMTFIDVVPQNEVRVLGNGSDHLTCYWA